MSSYMYTSINSGFSFYLENLVDPSTPSGVLKITRDVNAQGLEYVIPSIETGIVPGQTLSSTGISHGTQFEYPTGYRVQLPNGSAYPNIVGGTGPQLLLEAGSVVPGTFLYDLLVAGTIPYDPNAVLVCDVSTLLDCSGSKTTGQLDYWIGSNVSVGSKYSVWQFYDVLGTTPAAPIAFCSNIPVLVSSLVNPGLSTLRVYMENTYAPTFVVGGSTSVNVEMGVTYYPYGLGTL